MMRPPAARGMRRSGGGLGVLIVAVTGGAVVYTHYAYPQVHRILSYAGYSLLAILLLVKLFLVVKYAMFDRSKLPAPPTEVAPDPKIRLSLASAIAWNFVGLSLMSGGLILAVRWRELGSWAAGIGSIVLVALAIPCLLLGLRLSQVSAVRLGRRVLRAFRLNRH